MKRSLSVFVVLLVGLVLVGIFGSSAAAPPPAPPRTSLPTWTLPFSLVTATPAALDTAPVLPLDNATFTGTPAQPEPTDQPVTAAPPSPTVVPPTPVVPPQLVVPALKIDQSIVPVAIVGNIWDLADLGEQIGRLTTTGEHPGDSLAMTLVGHVTISFAHDGPFVDLGRLKAGDEVTYRWNGMDYRYSVLGKTTTQPEDVSQLYVPDGTRLLLVTCSDWSYFWRHYARRIIITAQLTGLQPAP